MIPFFINSDPKRDWTEDFEHENGNYFHPSCVTCGESFSGHKRRSSCKKCSSAIEFALITCGGTIGKVYFDNKSEYQVGVSNIPVYLRSMGVIFNHIPLLQKDSLEITQSERNTIAQTIPLTKRKVLITHGTDTIIETAIAIAKSKPEKTVVLTGSMQPLVFRDTDAIYNLGFAIGVLKSKPKGVYIAIGSNIYSKKDFTKLVKNKSTNKFELVC